MSHRTALCCTVAYSAAPPRRTASYSLALHSATLHCTSGLLTRGVSVDNNRNTCVAAQDSASCPGGLPTQSRQSGNAQQVRRVRVLRIESPVQGGPPNEADKNNDTCVAAQDPASCPGGAPHTASVIRQYLAGVSGAIAQDEFCQGASPLRIQRPAQRDLPTQRRSSGNT